MGRSAAAAALSEIGGRGRRCRQKWLLLAANGAISPAESHTSRAAMSQEKSSAGGNRACGWRLPHRSGWHF